MSDDQFPGLGEFHFANAQLPTNSDNQTPTIESFDQPLSLRLESFALAAGESEGGGEEVYDTFGAQHHIPMSESQAAISWEPVLVPPARTVTVSSRLSVDTSSTNSSTSTAASPTAVSYSARFPGSHFSSRSMCPLCPGKSFKSLRCHMRVHRPKHYPCLESGCQKAFRTRNELDRHKGHRHRRGHQVRCPVCVREFRGARKDNLNRHIKRYHGN
ncbi:hypothetical protein B0H66DRAFT_305658 [Apodospora peruviana]|uniref:C2H2 type master regulator of conidiophore development brlA n=1 Tax=Apodospora peruviana TaxID=516989 RepID=A0AAE0I1C6_9PEZI|nr:hypothetical protein B0H66DRAFT_305658 [Apodospora peruviana]